MPDLLPVLLHAEDVQALLIRSMSLLKAIESGETKKQRIAVAQAELQQQRLQGGTQGRPSMFRRLVKSVTPSQGPSLESTIKTLTGEVSHSACLPM